MSAVAGLEIEGLAKAYGGQRVVDGVSLSVARGETLVLFGPSSAGKTVLLRLVAGVVEPDAGRIGLFGRDITDLPPEARGIGVAFQNFALFPHMSAFDNIASPLVAKRMRGEALREAVGRTARLLKIEHVLGQAPRQLSNGQKQRTALARALVGEPGLLLLDDPLRNVDAKLRYEMRLELPRLLGGRGATVVHVTQDYREAMALGQRIAVLVGGRIAQVGTPEEIYLAPASVEIARLFGDPAINLLDVRPERDGAGPFLRLSGLRVPLPPALAHAVGRDGVLGLRPEHLAFTADPAGIPVIVEAETPLNEKTVSLVLTQGGREILVSRPSGTPGPSGGAARVAIDGRALLLFDRESGARIAPAGPSAALGGEAA